MKPKVTDMAEWMRLHKREHRKPRQQEWDEMFRNNRDNELVQANVAEIMRDWPIKTDS